MYKDRRAFVTIAKFQLSCQSSLFETTLSEMQRVQTFLFVGMVYCTTRANKHYFKKLTRSYKSKISVVMPPF